MRTRESHAVCLSVLVTLLTVAPAFAFEQPGSFSNVYNMDSAWNSGGDWTEFNLGGGTPTWDNSTSGLLKHANSDADQYYLQRQLGVVGTSTTWTVDITAKINSNGGNLGGDTWAPAGLYVGIMNDSDDLLEVVMQIDAIQMRNSSGTWVTIDTASNTSNTSLRIARDGTKVRIYRNGSTTLLGGQEYTVDDNDPKPGHADGDFVMFGDQSWYSDGTADFEIDYLAFDTAHAYVPEPATLMVMVGGLAVCLLAKRR